MKSLRLVSLLTFPILTFILTFSLLSAGARATGQTGGSYLPWDSIRLFVAQVTFTNNDASTVLALPASANKATFIPDTWWNSGAAEAAISCTLDDFVDYGDGSTVAPDGDGLGIHVGLNDPEFEHVGTGLNTSTWVVEVVVVAAGTLKDRISTSWDGDRHSIPNNVTWSAYGDTYAIPTTHVNIGCGLGLEFTAAGGHTIGDTWYVTNIIDDEYLGAAAGALSVTRADLGATIVSYPVFVDFPMTLTY